MHIVGGIFKRKTLFSPPGEATRPTASRLREAVFNISQHSITGAKVLDLFAGSGAMGLEAISRGAISATFIEKDRQNCRCIQRNIDSLGLNTSCHLICGDVFTKLESLTHLHQTFDWVYIDPPYGTLLMCGKEQISYAAKLLLWFDTSHLLSKTGNLFLEENSSFEPPTLYNLILQSARKIGGSKLYHYKKAF